MSQKIILETTKTNVDEYEGMDVEGDDGEGGPGPQRSVEV